MTSGELLKYRKGLFITADYESLFPGSSRSRFTLTVPLGMLDRSDYKQGWDSSELSAIALAIKKQIE